MITTPPSPLRRTMVRSRGAQARVLPETARAIGLRLEFPVPVFLIDFRLFLKHHDSRCKSLSHGQLNSDSAFAVPLLREVICISENQII